MGSSRFMAGVAAVLFLAVCAYFGAGLLEARGDVQTAEVRVWSVSTGVRLSGIAVRQEQIVRECGSTVRDGERLGAGRLYSGSPSGVFYFGTMGYENITPEELENLTAAQLESIMKDNPQEHGGVGRLVTDWEWYYLALTEKSAELECGEKCRVAFDGFDSFVPALLIKAERQENGRTLVILRLTADADGYLTLEKTGAELITGAYSGLRIPPDAVFTDEGGKKFVNKVTGDDTQALPVVILYTAEDFCLVEADGLKAGDRVEILKT